LARALSHWGAALYPDRAWYERPTSTWGGGSGLTVIYGVVAPVKPPRIGKVQRYTCNTITHPVVSDLTSDDELVAPSSTGAGLVM
jgi:hypothetical protein